MLSHHREKETLNTKYINKLVLFHGGKHHKDLLKVDNNDSTPYMNINKG
jgi:hypothetical protein